METGEIVRLVLEGLVVLFTWYLNSKLKSTKQELDLVVEDNLRLGQALRQNDVKWETELNAYQNTVNNLKLQLEGTVCTKEDCVKESKPKRQRKTK